jgi:hypothetical protein
MMQVPEAGHAATALFSLTAKSAPGCVSAKITTPLRLLMVRPVKSRLNPEIFPSGQVDRSESKRIEVPVHWAPTEVANNINTMKNRKNRFIATLLIRHD